MEKNSDVFLLLLLLLRVIFGANQESRPNWDRRLNGISIDFWPKVAIIIRILKWGALFERTKLQFNESRLPRVKNLIFPKGRG